MGLTLGLDVSTKTIGIALFETKDQQGDLILLHHVSPKIKPAVPTKTEELFKKVEIFETEFISKYTDMGIDKVVIEEPLLRSKNVNTVATLLRFNGMISRSIYDTLGIVPEYISSYDSRKYAFPHLMAKRTTKKDGTALTAKAIEKNVPVLFGGLPFDIDKKMIIWELVADLEPQITWLYDKKNVLKNENFDMTDAYTCVRAVMQRDGFWK